MTPDAPEPLLRIVAGKPSDEELAALTAVVASLSQAPDPEPVSRPSARAWLRRDRLRLAPKPGPGSWRRSSFR